MNIFIFKDRNLEEGILFNNNKTSSLKLSEIDNNYEVLFVLPNEMFSHRYFTNEKLKVKDIKSVIINEESFNLNKANERLKVLGPLNKHNFFVVTVEDEKIITSKLSRFGSSLKLASDAFLFVALMKQNCQYKEFIYLKENETVYKVHKKMLSVIDESVTDFSEMALKKANQSLFYEHKFFDISNTFNFATNKLAYYSLLLCFLILNFLGFLNLFMTNSNINEIEKSKQKVFSANFPNIEFQFADNYLQTIKNNYLKSSNNTLAKIGIILESIPNLEYIKYFKHNNNDSKIVLILSIPNAELEIVENYLQNKNIPLMLISKESFQDYINITYEINAN